MHRLADVLELVARWLHAWARRLSAAEPASPVPAAVPAAPGAPIPPPAHWLRRVQPAAGDARAVTAPEPLTRSGVTPGSTVADPAPPAPHTVASEPLSPDAVAPVAARRRLPWLAPATPSLRTAPAAPDVAPAPPPFPTLGNTGAPVPHFSQGFGFGGRVGHGEWPALPARRVEEVPDPVARAARLRRLDAEQQAR